MEIIWTETAKNDLKNIFNFVKSEININKAQLIVFQIFDKTSVLKNMREAGQKEPKFERLKNEYRRLIFKHYKIVYHISAELVYINKVFDSRQSPNKLFIK